MTAILSQVFQLFLANSGCELLLFTQDSRKAIVSGSEGYPDPKSPWSALSSATSRSLSTFATIEAAETTA